jgi:endonuclease YncB( thermonuclease family)
MLLRAILVLLVTLAAPSAAHAQQALARPGDVVTGLARVTDSDKMVVNGVYVLLWGIDGPEKGQPCYLTRQLYDCHSVALRELQIITAQGPVACTIENDPSRLRRGRIYATCRTADGKDVAEQLVRAGHALAFVEQTDKYKSVEAAAEADKVGLFRGTFMEPWVFAQSITGANQP